MPTSVLSLTAAGPGGVGPTQALKDKSCTTVVTITFADVLGGAPRTVVGGAPAAPGEYGNATWKMWGPQESVVTLAGADPTPTKTLTPDYPGRWLIQLTATPFGGSPTVYTGLVDILDPQIPRAAIPASNESREYDTDEGWSRSAEQMHKAVSRGMGFREIVSVTSPGTIAAGKLVAPTASWMVQWKLGAISFADYNNFAIEVTEVDDADARMVTSPVFLLLEAVDPAVGSGAEKGTALVKGVVPADTTGASIGGAPIAGASVYAWGTGANFEFSTSAVDTPVSARKVGRIILSALDTVSPPGVLYFDGHFEAFYHNLYVGDKLTVGGLIDPTGLELTPVAANPGGIAANTLWLDSTTGDALRWGADLLATVGGTSALYVDGAADPDNVKDTANGYFVGDVWLNTGNDDTFICVDASNGAAIWRRTGAHSAGIPPTNTDDIDAMYVPGDIWQDNVLRDTFVCQSNGPATASWIRLAHHSSGGDPTVNDDDVSMFRVGDIWFNNSTNVPWALVDASTGAAVWIRQVMEIKQVAVDPAPAEHNVHYIVDAVGPINVTLPPVATSTNFRVIVTSNDATPDVITVDGDGAETINGAPTYLLNAQYDSVTVVCSGSEWFVE